MGLGTWLNACSALSLGSQGPANILEHFSVKHTDHGVAPDSICNWFLSSKVMCVIKDSGQRSGSFFNSNLRY